LDVLVPADPRSEHASPRACPVVVFEESHVESSLALVAASWAIAMALGPVLQIRKIVENGSSRTVSIGYFVVLLIGFILWVAYGIAASNFVLIMPNCVAAIVCSATILVALRYRQGAVRLALLSRRVRRD
jgi:MtN3 and saliva related transmembrane protein